MGLSRAVSHSRGSPSLAGADPEGLYRVSNSPKPKRCGEAGTDSKCTKVLIKRRKNYKPVKSDVFVAGL